MALESGTYISDFVITNPTPGDPKSQGDDHIRLLKAVLKASFPAFTGPMPIAHDQVASKDYVNQTAFSSALPAIPNSTNPYALEAVNGSAGWKVADIYSNTTRLAQSSALALCF